MLYSKLLESLAQMRSEVFIVIDQDKQKKHRPEIETLVDLSDIGISPVSSRLPQTPNSTEINVPTCRLGFQNLVISLSKTTLRVI
jgi:hypothetical protein